MIMTINSTTLIMVVELIVRLYLPDVGRWGHHSDISVNTSSYKWFVQERESEGSENSVSIFW